MAVDYEIEKLLKAPLEDVLLKLYPATVLRWFYDVGLRHLVETYPDALPKGDRAQRSGADKTPKKTGLIELLIAVLRDKAMGRRLFEALPQATRDVLAVVTWVRRANLAELEETLGRVLAVANPDEHRAYYEPFLLPPENGLLIVRKMRDDTWMSSYSRDKPKKENYCLVLPDAVRKTFKTFVPPPPDFELVPLDKVPASARCRYSCAQKAIADLRLVAEYIAQGHLKYTKSEKVAMPSLKSLRELTGGPEFFEDVADSDLALLRTRLLVGGMAFAGEKERENLLTRADSAEPVREVFEKVAASAAFLHEELLGHLANSRHHWVAYSPHSVKDLASFFKKFPAGQWISWENMRSYHALREQVPSLFVEAKGCLQGQVVASGSGSWSNSIYVDGRNEFDLMSEPLLKGYAFLLAAFGLAEIACVAPKNAVYHRPKKEYLSPFDGLRFVRLTPLGEFVLGRRETYEVTSEAAARVAVILDETRLLATCRNADALTELALGQFLEKLAPGRYRMTPKSLLGGCKSREDIEERMRLFRRVVSANPPAVWEAFFERTLARIAPLALEPEYIVLKVGADEEIRRLFASDPALREITLKVEGLRIAVRRSDLKKLAKRLEQFGYLSPIPRLATGLATAE